MKKVLGQKSGISTMSHIKTIEFTKNGVTYELEIDAEDPKNLVLESVTQISGPKVEYDFDPTDFEDALDDDDWLAIDILLEAKP